MKKIYFVGIKGVGMTPLALIAKEAGCEVAGSDVNEKFITDQSLDKAGIKVYEGFTPENIDRFFNSGESDQLLIYTAAHGGLDNKEVEYAKDKNIKTLSLGRAIGEFMNGDVLKNSQEGISIAGTHGKTTTTALLVYALSQLNEDPTYIVGSSEIFPSLPPGKFGHGKYFVSEADEYVSDVKYDRVPKFLSQHPKYILLTNIDLDHPDIFSNVTDVKNEFSKLLNNLKTDGLVVANIDDENTMEVVTKSGKKYITYGESKEADYIWRELSESNIFELIKGENKYKVNISLSGKHNIANTASVLALLDTLGFSLDRTTEIVNGFKGTKRRSEEKGNTEDGALVIDDYAHHPREVLTTLEGLKKKYGKEIIVIFQPHTFSRTEKLLSDFASAFNAANTLIFLPVFASARESNSDSNFDEKYQQALLSGHKNAVFLPDQSSVIKYVKEHKFNNNYIILTMGAGDVYKIGEELVQ